jgi:sulfate adenylyltransferase large subunit
MAAATEWINESAFEQYLAQELEKELLRLLTCGSVDDGKSTLIGRLLYDSRNVFEDQIHAAAKATRNRPAGELDLSLLTDGLRAEREQGITIDVAYRYFATARRKFIIADTPGHEQYTRNMATGASTADLAVLLIDARLGVLPQSRRHACICSLVGIPQYVVAINKMDLAGYDSGVFERIRAEFSAVLAGIGIRDAFFLPMSALTGDNVVTRSRNMPWFEGPSLLEYLETVEIHGKRAETGFRMPVQRVARPDDSFRGYAGTVASGSLREGDVVTALPSGLESRVKRITTFDGDLREAFAPMAITVELADQVDISRGDLLFSGPGRPPETAARFEARLIWMDSRPLDGGKRYLLKHTARTAPARVAIRNRINLETLGEERADEFAMNAIGLAEIVPAQALFVDPYQLNRTTGSFILIDPDTNSTSAAGMIQAVFSGDSGAGPVRAAERVARWGHRGAVVRASSKAAALALERTLFDRGCAVAVVESEVAADALAGAGMLAILPVSGTRGEDISEIVSGLERNGVLSGRDLYSRGEGI